MTRYFPLFDSILSKNMFLIISLSLIYLACSCAGGYSQKEMEDFNQGMAEKLIKCDQEKLSGYIVTNVQYAECQNKITKSAYTDLKYPYIDLIDLLNAYRLYLAENLDAGNISDVEAKLLYEEYRQKVVVEERSRLEQDRQERIRAWQRFGESLDEVEVRF